eukprot:4601408-Amphidinium_carterae.1
MRRADAGPALSETGTFRGRGVWAMPEARETSAGTVQKSIFESWCDSRSQFSAKIWSCEAHQKSAKRVICSERCPYDNRFSRQRLGLQGLRKFINNLLSLEKLNNLLEYKRIMVGA